MKLRFLGAAKSVTGSMHVLESNGNRILLDCGLFQGRREESNRRNRNLPFDPGEIDRVVLSHAHIDHSGNLPLLVKQGYRNSIYSTFATRDLCLAMLNDSAHIQHKDAEYLNRKNEKRGLPLIEPSYGPDDVERTLSLFRGISYDRGFYVSADVKLTFVDAGHILGAALSIFEVRENGRTKRLGYIVDLGRKDLPILKDPCLVKNLDFIIIESTYGNRFHQDMSLVEEKLSRVVNQTVQAGGKIIIPSFSLGRTQEVVYSLNRLQIDNRIPRIKIFVDSPLSVNVTEIFRLHPECFDKEANRMIALDESPFGWGSVTYIRDVEKSKELNKLDEPCIIISASGMCETGRILHHLKNNIEDAKNTIMVVGFMAQDTLGRRIVERQEKLKIFGDEYRLRAKVEIFDEFSAHADRNGLLEYVANTKNSLRNVFVVHGEEQQSQALAEGIRDLGITDVLVPDMGQEVEL
jgi:metallo-beta-lactamase family protein